MSKLNLYRVDLDELTELLGSWDVSPDAAPAYARAIWHGLYGACVSDLRQITELPQALRDRLATRVHIPEPVLVTQTVSADRYTRKHLLQLRDGARIETVLLRYRERYTVCVSTQVGCPCGCEFCATGRMGFIRHLSMDEIVAQVVHFQRHLGLSQHRLSNVVFMGMGEPLLNEEETLKAIGRLVDPRGLDFAPGRITLSTVGIAPGIRRLAEIHARLPIKLAVSLHAATNQLRTTLMPINATYPLEALFAALHDYVDHTGRRVFVEWVMIKGINDTPEQAEALAGWLMDLPSHVNLIQLNPAPGYEETPSGPEAVKTFVEILDRYQIPHTMRQRRGGGIEAGCGQLATHREQL